MGELSYSAIDRAYPYQVALPDDICCMHNLTLIMEFCEARGAWHRKDEYKRILESGPLRVPEILRV
ncbi:hypothetical protein ACN2CC_35460 (plasmid) [Mesorhizobium muleiense]|uniref:hypothetical protein n=1 Tax=Mesorhizobium muleiense TaxID=1004279 RepID=UPI003AFA5F22